MSRLRLLLLLVGLGVLTGVLLLLGRDLLRLARMPRVASPVARAPGDLFKGSDQPPDAGQFEPVRMLDQRPAITNVTVIAADQVADEVAADELVLGVVIDGSARAYPINVLTTPDREVFNDVLAGHPIAATW